MPKNFTRKLINKPKDIVKDYLIGLSVTHPELLVDIENRIIFRNHRKQGKVALVSGGGSGHEPLHSGYVGFGMLDAACIGDIFASPKGSQIVSAIEQVDTGKGVLVIALNHAGDRMIFEHAVEHSVRNGFNARLVIIEDDLLGPTNERRGLGLAVLAEKILGAAAEANMELEQLCSLAQKLNSRGRSVGVAVSSCVLPGTDNPNFHRNDGDMDFQVGIHCEPGFKLVPALTANQTATLMIDSILDDLNSPPGSSFIALTNGMGGTPQIEIHIMSGAINRLLTERGHNIDRHLVGSYITSLEMKGCSLSLLQSDSECLKYWDAPVSTSALRWGLI